MKLEALYKNKQFLFLLSKMVYQTELGLKGMHVADVRKYTVFIWHADNHFWIGFAKNGIGLAQGRLDEFLQKHGIIFT